MRSLRPLPKSVLAAGILLALAGLARAQQPATPHAAAKASTGNQALQVRGTVAVPATLPPLVKLSATRERPLFVRSRRPPPVPKLTLGHPEIARTVPSDKLPAELVGIVMGPDQTYAILKINASQEIEHIHRGEKVEDWNLDEIGPRYISLHRGSSKMRVELFDPKREEAEQEKQQRPVARIMPRRVYRPPPQRSEQRRPVNRQRFTQPRSRFRNARRGAQD